MTNFQFHTTQQLLDLIDDLTEALRGTGALPFHGEMLKAVNLELLARTRS